MCIIGIGWIAANSGFKVFATKKIYDGPLRSGCVPFLNCHACPLAVSSCPIGIIQHFAAIHQFPFFAAGFLGIIGAFFGRAACGWLCPFGWLQDQAYKIKTKKIRIPKPLTYLKYVSLALLAVALPYMTGTHWFSRICPWGTLSAGIPWLLWNPIDPDYGFPVIEPGMVGGWYWVKIAILVLFLGLFIFTKRPFCRTLCPLGALYSLFNPISLMRLEAERADQCARCGRCREVCPVDIDVATTPNSPECIRCLECTVCNRIRIRWSVNHE